MTIKVAINGFGRIGRLVLRAAYESKNSDIEIVAINDLGSAKVNAHLLKYDSVHGAFPGEVSAKDDSTLTINGKDIKVFAERDPKNIPWKEAGVDVVHECTGLFVSRESAAAHLEAGAKKVIISAPGTDVDLTVVYGVNHDKLQASHEVISNASCTTNCLAPVASVLNKLVGIEKGYMTTVHAYTGDQPMLDTFHKKDMRRARAGALSMIPTSTGAAKAVGLVLPELAGKLDGSAIRVPTPNVSVVDLTFIANKETTVAEVNQALKEAANGALNGVLGYNEEPLVSSDFNHSKLSSIFDSTQTQVVGGNLVRVVSWYDNEWGFSNRMLDTTVALFKAS